MYYLNSLSALLCKEGVILYCWNFRNLETNVREDIFFIYVYKSNFVCLHWFFVAAHGLSLVVWWAGFSLWWLLLSWSMSSRREDFSSCGA